MKECFFRQPWPRPDTKLFSWHVAVFLEYDKAPASSDSPARICINYGQYIRYSYICSTYLSSIYVPAFVQTKSYTLHIFYIPMISYYCFFLAVLPVLPPPGVAKASKSEALEIRAEGTRWCVFFWRQRLKPESRWEWSGKGWYRYMTITMFDINLFDWHIDQIWMTFPN